jgi:hypothetical protein
VIPVFGSLALYPAGSINDAQPSSYVQSQPRGTCYSLFVFVFKILHGATDLAAKVAENGSNRNPSEAACSSATLSAFKVNQSPIRGFLLHGTASNPSEVLCVGVSQLANVVVIGTRTGR